MEKKQTFTVMDSKRGKTFATLDEANAYEREHRKRTGEFVAVVEGTKAVTHTYGAKPTATPAPKKTAAKPKATAKKATKPAPKKSTAKKTPTKGKTKTATKRKSK